MTWYSLSPPEVLKRLKTNQKRLVQYGENKLEEKKPVTPWQIFFNQFKSVLIAILLIASIASFAIGEVTDAFTILAIVILNAILGFTQEFKAEKALEALKKMLALKAKVIRAGVPVSIDTRFIVPGDIVVLEIGEKVPADLYLLKVESLQIDESVLTGESQRNRSFTPRYFFSRTEKYGLYGNHCYQWLWARGSSSYRHGD